MGESDVTDFCVDTPEGFVAETSLDKFGEIRVLRFTPQPERALAFGDEFDADSFLRSQNILGHVVHRVTDDKKVALEDFDTSYSESWIGRHRYAA